MFSNDTSGNGASAEKKVSDKRGHPRLKMREAVVALLEMDVERQPALLVNVGKGGVCVDYFREKPSCRWRHLTISSFHTGCFLGQLPVEIIHDGPLNDSGKGQANGMRRCGLKFFEPTYTQQALWNIFLEQNATAINGKESPEL